MPALVDVSDLDALWQTAFFLNIGVALLRRHRGNAMARHLGLESDIRGRLQRFAHLSRDAEPPRRWNLVDAVASRKGLETIETFVAAATYAGAGLSLLMMLAGGLAGLYLSLAGAVVVLAMVFLPAPLGGGLTWAAVAAYRRTISREVMSLARAAGIDQRVRRETRGADPDESLRLAMDCIESVLLERASGATLH